MARIGFPVDVVIHYAVAVLQVLALAYNVGCNQDVDLVFEPAAVRVLGNRRKPFENVVDVLCVPGGAFHIGAAAEVNP